MTNPEKSMIGLTDIRNSALVENGYPQLIGGRSIAMSI
jgi:hypothetical protein